MAPLKKQANKLVSKASPSPKKSGGKGKWNNWWKDKITRNEEMVSSARKNDTDKVADLLNSNRFGIMAADVNYASKENDDKTALHYAV